MNKKRVYLFFLFLLIFLVGCKVWTGNKLEVKTTILQKRPLQGVSLSRVNVSNNQIEISGSGFSGVNTLNLKGGAIDQSLTIVSKSNTSIIATATKSISLLVGNTFNLVIGTVEAEATYPVTFTLTSMGASTGQVLKYNGSAWAPSNLSSSQLYLGTYDAAANFPNLGSTTPSAGDYYIVTAEGTYNGILFPVNSWIMFNGTDWEKISNDAAVVTSFKGRRGLVVPLKGDYNLSLMSDVNFTTEAPGTDKVLTYDASGKWIAKALPAGNAGSVTSVSGTLPISVATGGSTPVVSISQAAAGSNGYLSSTDWNTFNNKQGTITAGTADQVFRIPTAGGAPVFGAIDLTKAASVTGALPVGKGGTGLSAGTQYGIPYFSSSSAIISSAPLVDNGIILGSTALGPYSMPLGTAGQILTSAGTLAPSWITTLPIANGGTGSGTQNFVDLTANQTIAGIKTFSSTIVGSISGNAATATTAAALGSSPTLVTPNIGVATGTSLTTPFLIGGSNTTQALTYKTTTGSGTAGADHIFQVGNNGTTEAMRILNNGNVGIGTTAPYGKLDVVGRTYIGSGVAGIAATGGDTAGAANILNVWSPTALDAATANTETTMRLVRNGTAGTRYNQIFDVKMGSYGTGINAQTQVDFKLGNTGNAPDVDVMTMRANGNVGIGTTAPADKLVVAGKIAGGSFSGNHYNTLDLSSDNGGNAAVTFNLDTTSTPSTLLIGKQSVVGTGDTFLQGLPSASGYGIFETWGGLGTVLATGNATPIIFRPNRSEVMRVTSNGNVGIGITVPTTKLQVAGEISPSIDNTYSLGDATLRYTAVYAVNGTVQTSDARQKQNIQDSDLGLDFINKLRPVSYNWISGPDDNLHYGLIAQEAEKAILDSHKNDLGQNTPIVDRDEKSDRYGLRYSEFISPLIKAVQELYDGIKSVLARVINLENKDMAKDKEIAKLNERLNKIEKMLMKNK
jgi:hypothetical protein